jgi:hypothetical protein
MNVGETEGADSSPEPVLIEVVAPDASAASQISCALTSMTRVGTRRSRGITATASTEATAYMPTVLSVVAPRSRLSQRRHFAAFRHMSMARTLPSAESSMASAAGRGALSRPGTQRRMVWHPLPGDRPVGRSPRDESLLMVLRTGRWVVAIAAGLAYVVKELWTVRP